MFKGIENKIAIFGVAFLMFLVLSLRVSVSPVRADDSSGWYVCTCDNGNYKSYKTQKSLMEVCPVYCQCSNSAVKEMKYYDSHESSGVSYEYKCYCKLPDQRVVYSSYREQAECNCVCNAFCWSKPGSTVVSESCTGVYPADELKGYCGLKGDICNPIGINNVSTMIGRIIRVLMGIIGSIALVMFIWAGFLWMTARGNKETTKKSVHIMVWAAMGLGIIFASYAVLRFIFNIFDTLP